MDHSGFAQRHGFTAAVLAAVVSWLSAGAATVRAQTLANAVINGFEMPPAGSLEQQIVNRLSWTGQYEPRDLARLARLTVLETIAMYQNTRADLRATSTGARLEGEMSALWDAAELFSVVASGPIQAPGALDRSRALMVNVDQAFQSVSASLAELPGVSNRAAGHLQNVARLLPLMNDLLETIDADLNEPPDALMASREAVAAANAGPRARSRQMVEGLRRLIGTLKAAPPATPGDRAVLIAALEHLHTLAGGFDQLWDAGADDRLLATAFRPVREHVHAVEPFIERQTAHTADGATISARWRELRQDFQAVSDGLGFPRVIVGAAQGAAAVSALKNERGSSQAPSSVGGKLIAQIDRTVAALSDLLARNEAGPNDTTDTAEMAAVATVAARARLDLLVLRQRALGGASNEALARALHEIERSGAALRPPGGGDGRVVRGVTAAVSPERKRAAEALDQLRAALPARASRR